MGTAILIGIGIVAGIVLLYLLYCRVDDRRRVEKTYRNGLEEMRRGNYGGAQTCFEQLHGYKDSARLAEQCQALRPKQIFDEGVALMKQGEISLAITCFSSAILADDPQAQAMLQKCNDLEEERRNAEREAVYQQGLREMREGKYRDAEQTFGKLWAWTQNAGGAKEKVWSYRDSDEKQAECRRLLEEEELKWRYKNAVDCLKRGELLSANMDVNLLPDGYRGKEALAERVREALYAKGVEYFEKGRDGYQQAKNYLEELPRDYRDADEYLRKVCLGLYGLDFCAASPSYKHVWENLEHIVDVDNELRRIGHGRRRCECCGKTEDFSYDYDVDGY